MKQKTKKQLIKKNPTRKKVIFKNGTLLSAKPGVKEFLIYRDDPGFTASFFCTRPKERYENLMPKTFILLGERAGDPRFLSLLAAGKKWCMHCNDVYHFLRPAHQ